MRKNLNTMSISGYLHSFGENGRNNLEVKVSGEKSKNPGTEFISGVIQIAVDEAGLNVVPVHFTYVTATYGSSGKNNPNFATLKKLISDGKTWVTDGKENATKIKVDGSIALNDFYVKENDEDRLVSTKVNEGSFVNIINQLPDEKDRSTFTCDMLITTVKHIEADEERNIPEDYATIRGAIFNFRNELLPLEFVIRNPQGMNYFESLDLEGSPFYTKLWGRINCSTSVSTVTEESAFGEASVRTYERKMREWVVTGAPKEGYEFGEENVMTAEELQTAMQNREIHLADIKKRAEEYSASKETASVTAAPAAPKAKTGNFIF